MILYEYISVIFIEWNCYAVVLSYYYIMFDAAKRNQIFDETTPYVVTLFPNEETVVFRNVPLPPPKNRA